MIYFYYSRTSLQGLTYTITGLFRGGCSVKREAVRDVEGHTDDCPDETFGE